MFQTLSHQIMCLMLFQKEKNRNLFTRKNISFKKIVKAVCRKN